MLKYSMIKVSAPGKICIAGEWAVLDVGNPLIASAVEKRVFSKIEKSEDEFIHVSIKDFNIKDLKAVFDKNELIFKKELTKKERKQTAFIKSAIETSLEYLRKKAFFNIETWGQETTIKTGKDMESIGFGSSAASTVAVISGIFKFFGKTLEKEIIYKLSAISHYFAQGKAGSGFDIACSVFGGIIVYKRFDPDWLIKQFKDGKELREIVEMKWPGFYIESLKVLSDLNLLLGWTGESSSTSEMVKQFNEWKKDNEIEYKKIFKRIRDLVEDLIKAWKAEDKGRILEFLKKDEIYLRELGEKSGLNIETENLATLSNIANKNRGAGKLSGAGGGDCGIAITFNKQDSEKIKKEWGKNGIYFINTKLSFEGVKEEVPALHQFYT
jgi:phosphomevalonate kinase